MIVALAAAPADAQVAPKSFGQCSRCHMVTADGKNRVGPRLYDIYNSPAGKVGGFKYSAALIDASLRWDAKTLDAWIANPRALVPGNKMKFGGEKDPGKRAEIIAWLKANRN
jgi:cytochrome c